MMRQTNNNRNKLNLNSREGINNNNNLNNFMAINNNNKLQRNLNNISG
jgi:hypothetical protein